MIRYPIVCPSCRGRGLIDNPEPSNSSSVIICSTCKGTKLIIVEEENESNSI